MTYKYSINYLFEEISQNYYVSPDVEPILKNALNVKLNIENAFDKSEKETPSYHKIISTIDSHIAAKINQCRKRF